MFRNLFILIAAMAVSGCTSIQVDPMGAEHSPEMICIEKNDKVIVGDFLPVVEARLEHHGIEVEISDAPDPERCPYILTYTAHQTWDMATYLHSAELRLEYEGKKIADASYSLRNKGGLSLAKWGGVKGKMDPVVDELLGK